MREDTRDTAPPLSERVRASTPPAVTMADYEKVSGRDIIGRTEPFFAWQDARRDLGMWPYSRTLVVPPGPTVQVVDDSGRGLAGLNLASQDYLSLSRHPSVSAAAHAAIDQNGLHSAGSPVGLGYTALAKRLEVKLADHLQMGEAVLFPTGAGARLGALTGLVRPSDHVVIDAGARASLMDGAHAATDRVTEFEHLSVESLCDQLSRIRLADPDAAILVVTETLFSSDACASDIEAIQSLCRGYGAALMVDVSNDLATMGPQGTGLLGIQNMLGKVDIVSGCFSPALCSAGGFVAVPTRAAKEYIKFFATTHRCGETLSPMQAAVVLEALRLARGREGTQRRERVLSAAAHVHDELERAGLRVLGTHAPFVPIQIGADIDARLAIKLAADRGVIVNLVEFPAVAPQQARLCLHLSPDHDHETLTEAAALIVEAIGDARMQLSPSRRQRRTANVEGVQGSLRSG